MKTTLDVALVRWSVACQARAGFAAGYTAQLGPFLSGWFARDMGMQEPPAAALGTFASSWRAGWTECGLHLRILAREEPHPFDSAADLDTHSPAAALDECRTCGLARRDAVHRMNRRTHP